MSTLLQYIKPSVLRLEFTADQQVNCTSNCKSNATSSGQCITGGGETCVAVACDSPGT
jgi:hypothetical protein